MGRRLPCRCAAGLHSLGRHEPFCPRTQGRTWCEDCGREHCVCRPRTVHHHPAHDPWATPAKAMP